MTPQPPGLNITNEQKQTEALTTSSSITGDAAPQTITLSLVENEGIASPLNHTMFLLTNEICCKLTPP